MTATLPAEAQYYQSIEEFFVSRRGDPLTLSNADWLLIRSWREARIPLRVVLRGIQDALDAHAHSWSRGRRVGSLRYCAAEVEVARERWQRALALGQDEAGNLPESLSRMSEEVLLGAAAVAPQHASPLVDLARRLRERARQPGAPSDVEAWLRQEEATLLRLCREDLGRSETSRIEEQVEAELAPYRERIPARVLSQIRQDSTARQLLARRGLPRLSLFER